MEYVLGFVLVNISFPYLIRLVREYSVIKKVMKFLFGGPEYSGRHNVGPGRLTIMNHTVTFMHRFFYNGEHVVVFS